MLLHKLKTLAAIAAASMLLIATSLVVVSFFSSPVRSAQEPKRSAGRPARAKADFAPSPKPAPIEEVAVVAVHKSQIQRSTNQGGTVEPFQKVDILPTASGLLARLTVDLGSMIKRGDLLAEIQAPELELELARAEAAARQAKARIATAQARIAVAQSAVRAAGADVDSAQIQLQAAVVNRTYRDKQFQRIQELVKQGSVEKRVEDEELDRLETARTSEVAAKAQVSLAQANLVNAQASATRPSPRPTRRARATSSRKSTARRRSSRSRPAGFARPSTATSSAGSATPASSSARRPPGDRTRSSRSPRRASCGL